MYWLIKNNFTFILASFYKAFIIKRRKSKHKSPIRNSSKITILALNGNKFRGDLECLSQVDNFRILTLESMWQTLLMHAFTNSKTGLAGYVNAEDGSIIGKWPNKINIFFEGFISALLKLIKIDCVITVNYRYVEDLPWVTHFEKKGIPHICLYRESLIILDRFYDSLTAMSRRYKAIGYPITHVIVQNQACRSSFVKSGFATEAQVSVCGALRMDNFLKMINSRNGNPKTRRKRVILFYFPLALSIFGNEKLSGNDILSDNAHKYSYAKGIWPKRSMLFTDLHMSLIQLAIKYPEVDFVIRPKRDEIKVVWDEYIKIVNEAGIDFSRVKNYTVEPDANTHDLIMNSDVVIGLDSTAIVESAIAGKPVIFPLFYKYKETEKFNDFIWRKHIDLFDVAESADELKSLVVERLRNPKIKEGIMKGRRRLFKECFSDIEGVALKKYVETIKNVVTSEKRQN